MAKSFIGREQGEVNWIRIVVSLEDEHIEIDLDTGASVTVISEQYYEKKLKSKVKVKLHLNSAILKTNSGEILEVLGEITVIMKYQRQKHYLFKSLWLKKKDHPCSEEIVSKF